MSRSLAPPQTHHAQHSSTSSPQTLLLRRCTDVAPLGLPSCNLTDLTALYRSWAIKSNLPSYLSFSRQPPSLVIMSGLFATLKKGLRPSIGVQPVSSQLLDSSQNANANAASTPIPAAQAPAIGGATAPSSSMAPPAPPMSSVQRSNSSAGLNASPQSQRMRPQLGGKGVLGRGLGGGKVGAKGMGMGMGKGMAMRRHRYESKSTRFATVIVESLGS